MPSALAHYWGQADEVSHLLAWLLLAMSLLSWTLILAKAWAFRRIRLAAPALSAFWAAPTLPDALALLQAADQENIYTALAHAGAHAADSAQHSATLSAGADPGAVLTRALRQELNRLTVRLENGLTMLASIGATAPFVGLLGTVWGIYHALSAISASGAVQLDQLAGPVGEALIMTAFGLIVAIPAVLAYNAFNRINRITLAELDAFAHDLHAHLRRA
ncbi:MAG: MotA/TolQ/ExbB proton channel family protein [Burkholderiales bacterium]|nr:MotA/TolQ/ExbB proton channel family protein [Burkholderiales bacterium]